MSEIIYFILIFPFEFMMLLIFEEGYRLTNSYGMSVMILSFLVNIALLPFYYLAEKWKLQEKQIKQKMQWELDSIKRHSSKRERFLYTQEVYRRNNYHPLSAIRVSFGFLIQIPFFFAAYSLLSEYPGWVGQGFLFLADLSEQDQLLDINGFSINLLPFVMAVVNLLSAMVYTAQMDRSERFQLWALTAVFFVVLYASPAGLLFYWIFSNLFSLFKNLVGQKLELKFLTPSVTEVNVENPPNPLLIRLAGMRELVIQRVELKQSMSGILFLLAMAGLVIREGMTEKMQFPAPMIIAASIFILATISLGPLLKTFRGAANDFRELLYRIIVWALGLACLLVASLWLGGGIISDQVFQPSSKQLLILLLALVFLLFIPVVFKFGDFLDSMPNHAYLYILSSTLVAFTLFIHNPMSLYLASDDFSYRSMQDVISFFKYFTVLVMLACTLYFLLGIQARRGVTVLVVTALLVVILYSSVLNIGLLDHFKLNSPGELDLTAIQALVELIALTAIFLITTFMVIRYRRLTSTVVSAILLVSIVSTFPSILEVFNAKPVQVIEKVAEHDRIIRFSSKENVLAIMLDGFPGAFIDKIKSEMPEIFDQFEGFVWYPNTLTTHAGTWGSIAALYGGHKYTVESINKAGYSSLQQALNEAIKVYPNAFIPAGYEVTYVRRSYKGGCEQIVPGVICSGTRPFDNFFKNEHRDNPQVNVPRMLAMISLFKAAPYLIKSRIYDNGSWLGANAGSSEKAYTYKLPEWNFIRALSRASSFDAPTRTFKFVQVQIPHTPVAINDQCVLEPQSANVYSEAVCVMREISHLLSRMKEQAVYDKTKIVIISDHGWWVDNPMFPDEFSENIPVGYDRRASPGFIQSALLIKNFNSSGPLNVSDRFLSNADLSSILCSAVGGCEGVQTDPTLNAKESRLLTFNITKSVSDFSSVDKFELIEQYEVQNNLFNYKNWQKIR